MFKAVGLALSTAVLCEAIARQEPVEDVAPAEEVVDGEPGNLEKLEESIKHFYDWIEKNGKSS